MSDASNTLMAAALLVSLGAAFGVCALLSYAQVKITLGLQKSVKDLAERDEEIKRLRAFMAANVGNVPNQCCCGPENITDPNCPLHGRRAAFVTGLSIAARDHVAP